MNANDDLAVQPVEDVGAERVARVYADALLRSASARQQGEAIYEELDSLNNDVFQKNPQLELFLSSAAIGRRHKTEVLKSVFETRASEFFFNFLMVLNEHERLNLLRPIQRAYKELLDQQAHRIRIQVRTAVPLPDDQRERLAQGLRDTFHLEPILETRVEPDLLGGLVVRIGDWLYDGSVRNKLDIIRNQIIESSSHEIQSGRDRFSNHEGN